MVLVVASALPDPHEFLDQNRSLFQLDNRNALSYLSLAKSLAFKEDRSLCVPPSVMRTGVPGELKVSTAFLRLSEVRVGCQKLLQNAENLILDLKLGLDLTIHPRQISDNFSNDAAGSSFIIGSLPSEASAVNEALLRHCVSTGQIFSVNQDQQPIFSVDQATRWLNKHDKLQKLILLIIHLFSGMPARATELATYTLVNEASRQRSLYVLGDQVFFLPHYNKTRSWTQSQKYVARFLDRKSSFLLLQDLCILRPFAAVLLNRLGWNQGNQLLCNLFAGTRGRLSPEDIRSVFQAQFAEVFRVPLLFSEYRHVAASYAWDARIDADLFDPEEESDDAAIVAQQFGHSFRVAMQRYGRAAHEHGQVRDHLIEQYRLVSQEWHRFLGLRSDSRLPTHRCH